LGVTGFYIGTEAGYAIMVDNSVSQAENHSFDPRSRSCTRALKRRAACTGRRFLRTPWGAVRVFPVLCLFITP
jgi:hypothetical protein